MGKRGRGYQSGCEGTGTHLGSQPPNGGLKPYRWQEEWRKQRMERGLALEATRILILISRCRARRAMVALRVAAPAPAPVPVPTLGRAWVRTTEARMARRSKKA